MTTFVAGWNMPGCLPEMEPVVFESSREAKEYIAGELYVLDAPHHVVVESLIEDYETVEVEWDGYIYWVDYGEES